MLKKSGYVEKNTMLVKEFDRYVLEYPEFAKIPNNALVVMQMDGDEEFNRWAKRSCIEGRRKKGSL